MKKHLFKQRRALFVFDSSWRGWRYHRKIISAFARSGVGVTVLAPLDEATGNLAEIDGIEYFPWQPGGDAHNAMRNVAGFLSLSRAVRRLRPDAVFSFGREPNLYAGLACRMLRISFYPNVHGLDAIEKDNAALPGIFAGLYGAACAKAEQIFVQNDRDAEILRANGTVSVPIVRLNGDGVDLDHFVADEAPDGRPLFLYINSATQDEGARDFVAAAKALEARGVEADFVIVSEREMDKRGLRGVVTIIDRVDDIRPWIEQSNVVVVPSHGNDGMPSGLLEAASCGRMAITSDAPGCLDAIIRGESAFVYAAHDVDGLCETIIRAIAMPLAARHRMGRVARQLAEDRFSCDHVVSAYLECMAPQPTPYNFLEHRQRASAGNGAQL